MIKIDENIYDTTVNLNGVMKLFMIKFSFALLAALNIIRNLVVQYGSYDDSAIDAFYYRLTLF